ncbi:MAG TPA: hypothetical protein ENH05_03470 [Rhizobiales bacterium]|nr:hypothetical protein [Hyphomicrobiales bacterium]
MAKSAKKAAPEPEPEPGDIPFMQRLLDNPFILLFIGVTVPTLIYLVWGVVEVAQIPLAK